MVPFDHRAFGLSFLNSLNKHVNHSIACDNLEHLFLYNTNGYVLTILYWPKCLSRN